MRRRTKYLVGTGWRDAIPVPGHEFFWVDGNHIRVEITFRVGHDPEQDFAWSWVQAEEHCFALLERTSNTFFKTAELTTATVRGMVRNCKLKDRNKMPTVEDGHRREGPAFSEEV